MAWIEIVHFCLQGHQRKVSPPARVAWIEMPCTTAPSMPVPVATREGGVDKNLVGRGPLYRHFLGVATREGGVDRNGSDSSVRPTTLPSPPARVAWIETQLLERLVDDHDVATREGGVDRNTTTERTQTWENVVATREGGVDRNWDKYLVRAWSVTSPPARVAWIETQQHARFQRSRKGRHPRGWRG